MVAFEAAVIDWLPCVRIASWPGVPRDANEEAGDTFVVRPFSDATAPTYSSHRAPSFTETAPNSNGARKERLTANA